MTAKRALITGITGQDGRFLADLLHSKGYQVFGLLKGQANPRAEVIRREQPFVEAWVRVRGETVAAKAEARKRFLTPLFDHLNHAGLGHVSEIADAEPPFTPCGCPFQAWSLGELLRLDRVVLK